MGRKCRLTEGGCLYCRKRRLRCNLDRPRCLHCQNSHQDCIYGTKVQLRWVGGMAARGRLATSSSPVVPMAKEDRKLTLPINPFVNSSALEDPHLIAYFDDAVLPRFQIYDGLVQLDFNAVTQDQTLQQAILAISKAHFALNSKVVSSDITLIRAKARHSALESFRHLLGVGIFQESTAQQLFVINVLLCMLDGIIAPCDKSNASMCHLRGGFAILSRWKDVCARILVDGGMQAHLLSIFTTIDLNHALLKGGKPFFEPVTWLMFANTPTWFGSLLPDDQFLTILKAYAEAAYLGHIIHVSEHPQDSLRVIERCLTSLERIFKLPNLTTSSPGESKSKVGSWTTFCSFYQLCGTIYLERALRLKSIDSEPVQAAVRHGVAMLTDETLPGMMSHCLIFPVLVFGTHCIRSQDQHAVLEALSPTSSYLSFGSLQLMTKFLQHRWNEPNMHATWWECFESISETTFLF